MIGTQNYTIGTADATVITNNGVNALLLAIGDEAKKALLQLPWSVAELANACCTHLRSFANKQSITVTNDMLDDVVVAIVLISDGHEESFSLAQDIGLVMKAVGICSIGIVTVDRTDDIDEMEDTIESSYMSPVELILEPLVSRFDSLVLTDMYMDAEESAKTETELFVDAVAFLLRFLLYESADVRSNNVEKIRNSGISYFNSIDFKGEWRLQAIAEALVFHMLFVSPIFAANAVFAAIRHGSSYYPSADEEDSDYVFSYFEDHLNADAYYCTKQFADHSLEPYDCVISVLTCGFDGKSTLFDEHGEKQYPEIGNGRLRKRIDRALNYPFSVTKRRDVYEDYCKENALHDQGQQIDDSDSY